MRKNRRIKIREFLRENILLLVLLTGIGAILFLTGWYCSLRVLTDAVTSAGTLREEFWKSAETVNNHVVQRGENETWLIDEDSHELLAGPFEDIYDDFDDDCDSWRGNLIARYLDHGGKIGYVNYKNGTVIAEAVFVSGSIFKDGLAWVQDEAGCEYAIDSRGCRVP